MNNIKLFGTTVQENIYNGMWNYGAALSLIMLLLIGITILFTNEEDGASNESGGVICRSLKTPASLWALAGKLWLL